jgi:hypothetical protein
MEYLPGIIAIGTIIAFALIGFVGLPYLLFFGGKGSVNPPENDGRYPPRSQIGEACLHRTELFMWVPVLCWILIFIFAMIFTAVVPAAIFLDGGRSLSAAVMPVIFMSRRGPRLVGGDDEFRILMGPVRKGRPESFASQVAQFGLCNQMIQMATSDIGQAPTRSANPTTLRRYIVGAI